MSYTVTLSWDSSGANGAPDTTVNLHDYNGENLILDRGFGKTETLHNDLKPVQDKATITIKLRTSLANTLMTIDPDIRVIVEIQKDAAAWFYGSLRPVTKWKVTGEDDSVINLEVLDNSERLKRKLPIDAEPITGTSITVSALTEQILDRAGYAASEYSVSTISNVLGYVLEQPHEKSPWQLLEELLFSYGYVFYFDEAGVFRVYDFSVESAPTPAATLNDYNIVNALGVERTIADYDGVEVGWYDVITDTGYQLVSRKANVFLSLSGNYGQRYPKTSSALPNNTIHSYALESDDRVSRIVGVSNIKLSYHAQLLEYAGMTTNHTTIREQGISLGYQNPTPPYTYVGLAKFLKNDDGSVDIQFYYDYHNSEEPSTLFLFGYEVTGDVQITTERDPWQTNANALNPWEHTGWYIYSEADASRLANILDRRISNSQYTYDLESESDLSVGDYVTLQSTDLNADTTARIVKKSIVESRRARDGSIIAVYELEGVGELGTLFGQVVGGTVRTSPPPARTQAAIDGAANGLSQDGDVRRTMRGSSITDDFTPNETGLYFTAAFIGFWDNASKEWLVKIQNDSGVGKAYFGDGGTKYVQWDGTNLTITGAANIGGKITSGDGIESDDYVAGSAGWGIHGDGTAEFQSATIRGVIEALSGLIGGFSLTDDKLVDSNNRIAIDPSYPRIEFYNDLGTLKGAFGYIDGIASYGANDYGLWIASGNHLVIEGGGDFSNGDYYINHDAAYLIADYSGTERGRFGSLGGGLVGLKIGDIDPDAGTGTGIYADETGKTVIGGSLIVGGVKKTIDTALDDVAASVTAHYPSSENLEAYWPLDENIPYPDDPSGAVYVQDEWTTVDGWAKSSSGAPGTPPYPSVSDGKLIWEDSGGGYVLKLSLGVFRDKMTVVRARIVGGTGTKIQIIHAVGGNLYDRNYVDASEVWQVYVLQVPNDYDYDAIWFSVDSKGTATNSRLEIDYIYIGDGSYLSQARDVIGGNDLTLSGGPVYVPGVSGSALKFDGSNYALCDSAPFRTPQFSMSAWFKTPGLASGNIINGIIAIGYGVRIVIHSSGNLGFFFHLKENISSTGYNYHDNQWHHVCGTFDGTTAELIVDGVAIGSLNISDFTWIHFNHFYIGLDPNVNNRKFNGIIDNVRIYNRALSIEEVRALNSTPGDITGLYPKLLAREAQTAGAPDGTPVGPVIIGKLPGGSPAPGVICSANWDGDANGDNSTAGSFWNLNNGKLVTNTGNFRGDITGASGTFSGALSGATGTFAGSLSGATGTFSGSLSAAVGTFAGLISGGSINLGSGQFTVDSSGNVVLKSAAIGPSGSIGDAGWWGGTTALDDMVFRCNFAKTVTTRNLSTGGSISNSQILCDIVRVVIPVPMMMELVFYNANDIERSLVIVAQDHAGWNWASTPIGLPVGQRHGYYGPIASGTSNKRTMHLHLMPGTYRMAIGGGNINPRSTCSMTYTLRLTEMINTVIEGGAVVVLTSNTVKTFTVESGPTFVDNFERAIIEYSALGDGDYAFF